MESLACAQRKLRMATGVLGLMVLFGQVEAVQGWTLPKTLALLGVYLIVSALRGLFIGPRIDRLTEMKQREDELMGNPTELLTGDKSVTLEPEWNTNGRVVLRQINPLPMTVLAIIPDIEVGDL